jgi:hypothetical protein
VSLPALPAEHIHEHLSGDWWQSNDIFYVFEHMVFSIILFVVEVVIAQRILVALHLAPS